MPHPMAAPYPHPLDPTPAADVLGLPDSPRARRIQARAVLTTLAVQLEDAYGWQLAELHEAGDMTPFLLVQRGTSTADVAVAVTVVPEGTGHVFQVEAFTEAAWSVYGDAFVSRTAATAGEAVDAITAYVPVVPTT